MKQDNPEAAEVNPETSEPLADTESLTITRAEAARVNGGPGISIEIEGLEALELPLDHDHAYLIKLLARDAGVPPPVSSAIEAVEAFAASLVARSLPGRTAGKLHAALAPDKLNQAVEALNERYALVESIGKIVRLDKSQLGYLSANEFALVHGNRFIAVGKRPKPLGRLWLQHRNRRTHDEIGLWAPPREAPDGALNLWRGFSIKPSAGNWPLMRAHIRGVIAAGDPALDDYVIRWLAWAVQNPGEQAEVALVLRGGQGTGKGTLGNTFCELFGPHAVHVTDPRKFATGQFNAHLARCCFLFADECYWGGDRQHEGQLKGMLTEPQLMIEPKGVDAYPVDNALHVLISSNNKWVVPVAVDDRRFVVCDVAETRKQDVKYFKALRAEIDSGGAAAMLHDLLRFDLGDWHPREIVQTAAKVDQQEQSLEVEDKWVLNLLDEGALPVPWGDDKKVRFAPSQSLLKHARASGVRYNSMRGLAPYLRQIGATQAADTSVRGWDFPTLQEARETWEKHHWKRTWVPHEEWTFEEQW